MSYPITNRNVAELLDSLDRLEARDLVLWSEPTLAELIEESDAANATIKSLTNRLEKLEALLCKRCATKWKADMP